MKRVFFLSMLSLAVFSGCSKDKPLKVVDDVCALMDDEAFVSYCLSSFDTDKDGILSMQEASVVERILVEGKGITSLKGLPYFFNLKLLECSQNNLSELDISRNTKLISLYCSLNALKSLDLSQNTKLQNLWCADNEIASLNVSRNTDLLSLQCRGNRITDLDISMLAWLQRYSGGMGSLFGFQKDGATISVTDLKANWGGNAPADEDAESGNVRWILK